MEKIKKKPKKWNKSTWTKELEKRRGISELEIFERFYQRTQRYPQIIWSGSYRRVDDHATMWPTLMLRGGIAYYPPICFRVDGEVEIPFPEIREIPQFHDPEIRRELQDRLNAIPNIKIPLDAFEKSGRRTFPFAVLNNDKAVNTILEIFNWYISVIDPSSALKSEGIEPLIPTPTVKESPLPTPVSPTPIINDITEPPPRIKAVTNRIIRDTAKTKELKMKYDYKCQVCGERIEISHDRFYAEVHHIRPLGGEHQGLDNDDNMLVLCPNHHAMFDLGIPLFLSSEEVQIGQQRRQLICRHGIDMSNIKYYNEEIVDNK